MAAPSTLPPEWLDSARAAASDLGLGTDLAGLPPEAWDRVGRAARAVMAARGLPLPPDWAEALARQAGRTDPAELARDEADAELAAQGEVFGTEDDA